jgi:hypothetical protein
MYTLCTAGVRRHRAGGALLVSAAERQPSSRWRWVIFFTSFEVFFFGAVVILAKWVLERSPVDDLRRQPARGRRDVAYFIRGHPRLTKGLDALWAEDDERPRRPVHTGCPARQVVEDPSGSGGSATRRSRPSPRRAGAGAARVHVVRSSRSCASCGP